MRRRTSEALRVALYHRVSTRDQDPTLARGELRSFASGRGWVVVLDIEETASTRDAERAGLARVLDDAHRREIDVVLVWRLDRFGRTFVETVNNVDALDRAGVRLVTVIGGIDTEGPAGRLLLHICMVVNEQEREACSERTLLGLATARAAGRVGGRPRNATTPTLAAVYMKKLARCSWPQVAAELACDVEEARNVWRAAQARAKREGTTIEAMAGIAAGAKVSPRRDGAPAAPMARRVAGHTTIEAAHRENAANRSAAQVKFPPTSPYHYDCPECSSWPGDACMRVVRGIAREELKHPHEARFQVARDCGGVVKTGGSNRPARSSRSAAPV